MIWWIEFCLYLPIFDFTNQSDIDNLLLHFNDSWDQLQRCHKVSVGFAFFELHETLFKSIPDPAWCWFTVVSMSASFHYSWFPIGTLGAVPKNSVHLVERYPFVTHTVLFCASIWSANVGPGNHFPFVSRPFFSTPLWFFLLVPYYARICFTRFSGFHTDPKITGERIRL